MKLNPETGQALGAINGPASIDGKMILPSGMSASWLNKDTIIYGYRLLSDPTADVTDPQVLLDSRARNDQADIRTYHLPTGRVEIVSSSSFNSLQAGGNRWEAWLGGYGCFGAIRDEVAGIVGGTGGRLGSVSWDGTIALTATPMATGTGAVLYAADGRVTEVPGFVEAAYGCQVLGPTSILWTSLDGIRGFNVNVPSVQMGYAFEPRRCYFPERAEEKEWICYWSNDYNGYIVHPYDKLEGYVLNTTGNAYWPDAIAWNGKIRVAFSWRQGELPEDVRIYDVDLSAPRVQFAKGLGQVGGNPTPPANTRIFISGDLTANLTGAVATSSLVKPQLGLLEDDIVFRLSMLATNILEPLKKRFPSLVVKSGFRETNSGIGQHEKGEAVDLQLSNQTDASLMEMAKFIRDTLPFDQLILNFSTLSKPWVHVSFSTDALRREVLTKDLADKFIAGLAFVRAFTGEQAAAKLREQDALDKLIISEMTKMQMRESRGKFAPVYSDDVRDSGVSTTVTGPVDGSGGPGEGGASSGGGDGANAGLVDCVIQALRKSQSWQNADNERKAVAIVERVAWLMRDQGAGLMTKDYGENIISWHGYMVSSQRICFADGSIYDIVTNASTDNPTASWQDNGITELSRYIPAIDPGNEYNMDWLACAVEVGPAPTNTSSTNTTPAGGGGRDGGRDEPAR